nr:radical SAM protein [Bacteroidota bacterium]
MAGFKRFQKRKMIGELFPAFQFISVTNDCNLRCQGCWVSKGEQAGSLNIDQIHAVINESKKHGSYFFGILGGEPLMYPSLLEIFRKHPDCYFQLFTNGTLLHDRIASDLRKIGNVTPLISLEGDEEVADIRRGANHVYKRTLSAIETATKHKLITGVAVSVCKSNLKMAVSDDFVQMLAKKGILYLWYYIYRPIGENPSNHLALEVAEIEKLRIFMVEGRRKFPVVLIDSYWDADGNPFCPAAEGLSHHINSDGYIEPCPVIQFASENIKDGNLKNVYEQSDFLRDFRKRVNNKTNGCVLMEDPAWVANFAQKHHAVNSSNRAGMPEALHTAASFPSHSSCLRIPEKHFAYRFAKKRAFFGLGAYG